MGWIDWTAGQLQAPDDEGAAARGHEVDRAFAFQLNLGSHVSMSRSEGVKLALDEDDREALTAARF